MTVVRRRIDEMVNTVTSVKSRINIPNKTLLLTKVSMDHSMAEWASTQENLSGISDKVRLNPA